MKKATQKTILMLTVIAAIIAGGSILSQKMEVQNTMNELNAKYASTFEEQLMEKVAQMPSTGYMAERTEH